MFIRAYIQTAIDILDSYDGTEPFHLFIKKYFAENKKFGSRDRKYILQLCYCYFRLGKSLRNVSVEDRLFIALFLCNQQSHPILQKLRPEWNELIDQPLDTKIEKAEQEVQFSVHDIFPFETEVSSVIDYDAFTASFLEQPDVFLRVRPGKEGIVKQKLGTAAIEFLDVSEHCIALKPNEKINDVLAINQEVVVQDYSSQQVINPLQKYTDGANVSIQNAWDCCAASGGKSILLKDYYPYVYITATDIRESIITNLNKRLKEANIQRFKSFVADVAAPGFSINQKFDLVLCDVPCSGSGTWGRTPEQLYFFDEKMIHYYSTLQKKIVQNAAKALGNGSLLLYITCSVFKKENEEVVQFIQSTLNLKLETMQYFTGYQRRADTLFAALFIKA